MYSNSYPAEILAELSKCLRVMPHDQNTSGFFITIFRKLKEFVPINPQTHQQQPTTQIQLEEAKVE